MVLGGFPLFVVVVADKLALVDVVLVVKVPPALNVVDLTHRQSLHTLDQACLVELSCTSKTLRERLERRKKEKENNLRESSTCYKSPRAINSREERIP